MFPLSPITTKTTSASTPQPYASQVGFAVPGGQAKFSGVLPPGATQQSARLLNRYFAKASLPEYLTTGFLRIRESGKGLSHFKFLQDTGVIWAPKMLVARSGVERFEISFLEFVESAYNYYCAPLSAEKLFSPMFRKLSPKKLSAKMLATPLSEIPKNLRRDAIPVKAATALASVLTMTIAGNYSLHFIKNLLTEKAFKKNKFSDIVNLSHGRVHDTTKDSSVAKKAKRRIAQCAAVSAAVLIGAIGIARYGARSKVLQKPLESFVKNFDFSYKNGAFGLTRNHLLFALFPINVAGYIDAARDHLERVEVACRTAIVGYYLCDGSERLEATLVKRYGRSLKPILKNKSTVKTFEEISQDALKEARALLSRGGKTPTAGQIEKKAMAILKPRLASKLKMFYIPLLVGMGGVAFGAALFNRVWTQYRYKQELHERNEKLAKHFEAEHI